jgi:S1-C subfamily serine protease
MWAHTEPSLTLGRGLMVTTGAIGGLLSLAVLWAMMPSAGRGGTASPVAVTSVANAAGRSTPRTPAESLIATSAPVAVVATTLRSTPTHVTPSTLPAPPSTVSDPRATVIAQQATTTTKRVSALNTYPIAASISDSLIITTMRAVAGQPSVTVLGSDGQPHEFTVVRTDDSLGLAALSATDAASPPGSYILGRAVAAGDVVTIDVASPITAVVGVDADGQFILDTWGADFVEGAPVLDGEGNLVGMCSRGANGPTLISTANAASLATPTPSPTATTKLPAQSWLGVAFASGPGGIPAVTSVDPSGPAAAVLVVGDIVNAIDGVAVATADQLTVAVAARASGTAVKLTVTHADQTTSEVSVTLGALP